MPVLLLCLALLACLWCCSAWADVPLHDFTDVSVWQPNEDGGHAGSVAAETERLEHGPAMRVQYDNQPPDWGNLTGPCHVPPEARALRLWVYKHSAGARAALHIWLFEPDGDGWLQQVRLGTQSVGEAASGWYEARLPVSGFLFEPRGRRTREMTTVDRMLIGCNYADLEVTLADMRWETGDARPPMPLPRTEELTLSRGLLGCVGVLDMAADGHDRDADTGEKLFTAHAPERLVRALEGSGFRAFVLKPGDLADPDVLTTERLDAVILPWGELFPANAREAFTAYLKAGGSFLAVGGYAFDRLVTLTAEGWTGGAPDRTAAEMGQESAPGAGPMNARTGRPGDAMTFELDQIPVFDPQFPLEGVTALQPAAWMGADATFPRYELTEPAQGFAACVLLGANSPVFPPVYRRLIPILEAYDQPGGADLGPALSVVHNFGGAYPRSSWAVSGFTSDTDLFLDSPYREALLVRVMRELTEKVFVRDLQTDLACYEPGETAHISLQVANHGRLDADRLLTVTAGEQEVLRRRLALTGGTTERLDVDLPVTGDLGDLVRVTARLEEDGRPADELETAFCVRSETILRSGPELRWASNQVTVDGRPTFLIGSNQTGMMYYSPHETPLVWDRDFANMAAHNFHLLRILHFSPYSRGGYEGAPTNNPLDLAERPERLVRQMDAIVQLAQKHRVGIFLSLHDWMGVGLTDAELAAQADWNRFWAARYRDVPGIIYDIQNEPSVDVPDRPDMVALWNAFLQERYGSDAALRAAWVQHPPEAALPNVPLGAQTDEWDDVRSADRKRFETVVLNRWIKANLDGIRAGDPDAIVTVGYLPSMPPADKLLGAELLDFSNMHYYGPTEGMATEFLLSDRRAAGKGLSLGECGAQESHDARIYGRYDVPVEESVYRFQSYIHYAAGLGAAFICNWCWKDFDESVFPWGLIQRQSDVAKPWTYAWEQASLLLSVAEPRYAPPPVVVVAPDSHRIGPRFGELHGALKRCFDLLLDQRVPFGVCTEAEVGALPAETRAVLWPLPYCPDDATFEQVRSWVEAGGTLYLSGDIQFDRTRRATRADRRTQLGLPAAEALSPFAVPEPSFAQPVLRTQVGQGKVHFAPYPLELRAQAGDPAVYRDFLQAAGVQPVRVDPAEAPVRVLTRPLAQGQLTVLARTTDGDDLLRVDLPDLDVSVELTGQGFAFVLTGADGAVVAAESQGAVRVGGRRLAEARGHYGLAALDGRDLRDSEQIVVFPHACREVRLAGLRQLRDAFCAIAPPAALSAERAAPYDGPAVRFARLGQVAVVAPSGQLAEALQRLHDRRELRAGR